MGDTIKDALGICHAAMTRPRMLRLGHTTPCAFKSTEREEMKVTLEFETGNAAFEDNLEGALERIFIAAHQDTLNMLTSQICGGKVVLDYNGNQIGWLSVLEEEAT